MSEKIEARVEASEAKVEEATSAAEKAEDCEDRGCWLRKLWKKRWFRIIRRVVVGILVALLITLFIMVSFIGTTIKTTVETVGSKAFKNKTTVENVDLSFLRGALLIENLVIGNPEGFKSRHAIYLGRIYVKMNTLSLLTGKIRVTTVDIDDPQIIYEIALGKTNVGVLLDNLNEFSGGNKPKDEEAKKAPVPAAATKKKNGGKKVVIDHVEVNGAKVTVALKMLGGNGAPLPLPPVVLNDLGKDKEGGVSIVEAVRDVFSKMVTSVTQVVPSAGKKVSEGVKSLFKIGN